MKKNFFQVCVGTAAVVLIPFIAQADNKNNLGTDRSVPAPEKQTAMDQSNNKDRLATTKEIRREIVKDKSLSTSAHNVTIVTADSGEITLKGAVRSGAEKDKILQIAKNVAPSAQVNDEMTLKGK